MAKTKEVTLSILTETEKTYLFLCEQIETAEKQKEFLKQIIIKGFEDRNITKDDKIQLVEQEKVKIDDLALRAALSNPIWNKIKKESVDRAKLEAAIKMDEIDSKLAEKALTKTTIKVLRRV